MSTLTPETVEKVLFIESFRNATDDSGNPLHPHFDAVFQDLMVLAQGAVNQGQKPELEDLYNRALLLHPELTAEDQQPWEDGR